MLSNRSSRLALACALSVSMPLGSLAQGSAEIQALQANCKMDYLTLCAGLSPEGPEIRACFKRNRANLSAGCANAISAYEVAKGRR